MTFSFFHIYGLLIGIGIVVAMEITERIWQRQKIGVAFYPVVISALVGGIIGARVYHVWTDWHLYQGAGLVDILAVWNGGLGLIGAILGGTLGVGLYLKFHQQTEWWWQILDTTLIGVPFAQAIGRWGNFFNHELYGLPTKLPWGIAVPAELTGLPVGTRFHPLFAYESLILIGLGLFLWYSYQRRLYQIGSGWFVGVYLVVYSTTRFFLEFLRIETARWDGLAGILSVAQWWMILGIMAGIWLIVRLQWQRR